MAATADVTRRIFDNTKRYFGRKYQQGLELFDWDVNEDWDELKWWLFTVWGNTFGPNARVFDSINIFPALESTEAFLANNFEIQPGLAFCGGRPVYVEPPFVPFLYDDIALAVPGIPVNYIAKGIINDRIEIALAVEYDVVDEEKEYVDNHGLDGSISGDKCRLKFLTGALAGSVFDIDSRVNAKTFKVFGDLSTAVAGDEYVILPPALVTPTGPQTDFMALVTWFEEVSEVEDPLLRDPALTRTPSYRTELRWMVYANWPGVDDLDTETGFKSMLISTIDRAIGEDVVTSAHITPEVNQIYTSQEIVSQLISLDARASSLERSAQSETHPDFEPSSQTAHNIDATVGAQTYDVTPYVFTSGQMINAEPFRHISLNPVLFGGSFLPLPSDETRNLALEINVADDTTTTVDNASLPLLRRQLALGVFRHSATTSAITRTSRMGENISQRGFNWFVDAANQLTVSPGEARRFGLQLQLPSAASLDTTIAGSYRGAVLPAPNTWVYIYAYHGTGERSLNIFLDEIRPAWDGTHPEPVLVDTDFSNNGYAFCIGMQLFDGTGFIQSCCMDGKVYNDTNAAPVIDTIIANGTTLPLQPPSGCNEYTITFEVTGAIGAGDVIQISPVWRDAANVIQLGINAGTFALGGAQVVGIREMEIPGSVSDNVAHQTLGITGAGPSVAIKLKAFRFNPLNFADRANWNQD